MGSRALADPATFSVREPRDVSSSWRTRRIHEQTGTRGQDRQGHRHDEDRGGGAIDSLIDGITKALKKGDTGVVRRLRHVQDRRTARRARRAIRRPARPSTFPSAASPGSAPARRSSRRSGNARIVTRRSRDSSAVNHLDCAIIGLIHDRGRLPGAVSRSLDSVILSGSSNACIFKM